MQVIDGADGEAARAGSLELETHSIDYVPATERQGHPRDLLTLWFGANAMAITLVTGGVAATFGLGLVWVIAAIAAGALIGIVFVAYHSAQGPQLGLPQMIQSRAQFGFFGANIPMVIVVLMYLGFFAGGAVIGAEAMTSLLGWPTSAGVVAVALLSVVLVTFGYKLLHLAGKIITPAYIIVFALLTIALVTHWKSFPGAPSTPIGGFQLTPFMSIISIIAAYYISYGPYVADYSRYLPAETSTAQAFWYTYAGVFLSAIWIMVLGAAIQAAFGAEDTVEGAALVAASMGPWLRVVTLVTLIVGIAYINAFNLYGAMMSSLTIASSFASGMKVGRLMRFSFIGAAALCGGLLASMASKDFMAAFENFVFFIITFLIPWSAVNLVDYYFIRKGEYVPEDLFSAGARYGSYNRIGLTAYAVGALVQAPFIDQQFYRGYFADLIGFDIAWLVGMIVPGAAYYLLARRDPKLVLRTT